MPFHQAGGLRYFSFRHLADQPLIHAIFTRNGGTSTTPWSSLNVGGTVGDNPSSVVENIHRIYHALGLEPGSGHDVWQVHSAMVQVVEAPRRDQAIHQADIMITNVPQVTLFMRFADCVPIFLYDPIVHAAAIAHAGWKGVVEDAPGAAVRALKESYGSNPLDLIAAIGPSICVDCYPIGRDVAEQVAKSFEKGGGKHLVEFGSGIHLDLWSACQTLLEAEGVKQFENAGICTATNLDEWFSHRGEDGKTGRFAALIQLNER